MNPFLLLTGCIGFLIFSAIFAGALPIPFYDFFIRVKESIVGEIQYGDKKSIKNGTAVYITCDTYMTLHEANPTAYPLITDSPEITFRIAKENHSVVFSPKEGHKLRKILEDYNKNELREKYRQLEEKEHQKLQAEREKALRDIDMMRKEIVKFSEQKDKELSEAVEKQNSLLDTMTTQNKMQQEA